MTVGDCPEGRSPAAPAPLDRAALLALPKVELHVHLEGSFTPERVAELASAAGEALPATLDALLRFDDLPSFLRRLDWWCGLVRSPGQAMEQARQFAGRLASDGVAYAEVTVNPTHWSGLPRHELLDAVCAGFDEAAAAGLTDCRVVVSILREQPGEDALELVRALGGYRPARVVGLGVDGDETAAGPTGPRFAPAFAEARAIGLGRTAHAGESSGPAGVASALDDLRVTRIDHGVRSVEDQELVRRLAGDGTALNICLTSNLALLYADLADHPIRRLLVAGVAVTINTDDPVPLRTTLTDELALAAAHCGWSLADAVAATARAIDAAFCRPDEAAALRSRLDAYAGAALPRGEASATRH